MKQLLKPASLLLYLLSLLVFFFLGMAFAGLSGAAKGQGLAGGAIVVGYGVTAAAIALLLAIYLAYQARQTLVVRINKVLGVLVLCFLAWIAYRLITGDGRTEGESISAVPRANTEATAPAIATSQPEAKAAIMGIGFFKPDFHDRSVMYFYSNPNLEKAIIEHMPTDSVVFKRTEWNGFDIAYAPPWLAPDHLKLDYELLYFKVRSLSWDFAEVVVNSETMQTDYVDRHAGKILYWPEFLLSVNSVAFLPGEDPVIRVKPLENAGRVMVPAEFMRPVLIRDNWMQVQLLDNDLKEKGMGWIQWKKDGKLRILWNLLS